MIKGRFSIPRFDLKKLEQVVFNRGLKVQQAAGTAYVRAAVKAVAIDTGMAVSAFTPAAWKAAPASERRGARTRTAVRLSAVILRSKVAVPFTGAMHAPFGPRKSATTSRRATTNAMI